LFCGLTLDWLFMRSNNLFGVGGVVYGRGANFLVCHCIRVLINYYGLA